MTMTSTVLLLGLLVLTGLPQERQPDAASNTASVDGDWMLSIHGDHVMQTGLQLKRDGTTVTGRWMLRGQSADAEGQYVDRTLTLTVAATISADHGARSPAGSTITLTLTMKDDGTLEGEMQSGRKPITVTAERFKPPKR